MRAARTVVLSLCGLMACSGSRKASTAALEASLMAALEQVRSARHDGSGRCFPQVYGGWQRTDVDTYEDPAGENSSYSYRLPDQAVATIYVYPNVIEPSEEASVSERVAVDVARHVQDRNPGMDWTGQGTVELEHFPGVGTIIVGLVPDDSEDFPWAHGTLIAVWEDPDWLVKVRITWVPETGDPTPFIDGLLPGVGLPCTEDVRIEVDVSDGGA